MRTTVARFVLLATVAFGARSLAPAAIQADTATPSPEHFATYVGLFGESDVQQPTDIALGPDGSIWITDQATDSLHKFDPDGLHLLSFGETGQGPGQFEFADFGAVGVDSEGNIYVLDTGNQRVQMFSPDLTFQLAWGKGGSEPGAFLHPSDIAVRDDGETFVVDAMSGKVQEFDASGRFVREIVPSGIADQFFEPARLGLDSEGNLYVPDLTRIYVFDRDGAVIQTIQTNEIDNGSLYVANGAAISPSGFLYVSDLQASTIVVFDSHGVAVGAWGSRGSETGQFNEVDTLIFDSKGRLLALDYANQRIQIFTLLDPSAAGEASPVASPTG